MSMSNISQSVPFNPNPQRKPNSNGKDTNQNTHKHSSTPVTVDPQKAAKIDHAHRSGLTIASVDVQPKHALKDLIVTQGLGFSEQDRKDNACIRKYSALLERGATLDTNQQKRLAEITQRRTPPTVEISQQEQKDSSYAETLFNYGLKLIPHLPNRASLAALSTGLFAGSVLAAQCEDPSSPTPKLSNALYLGASVVTLANGAMGLSQEAKNYINGKKVNLCNLGSSTAQAIFGAGMFTGVPAVRTASSFVSTGLHAAKALQTQSFEDAGAAIASAWSVAVGGDSVALANTVLAYSKLIQGGVSVWRKLEADAAQKAEVAALRQLVTVLETGVETEAEAQDVIAQARAVLKSPEVDRLPQTSALGKLLHIFRNFSETATQDLGLILASLCSLGKPSSPNLGTYLAASLFGFSLLPGADAQLSEDQKIDLLNKKLQEVTYLAGNQTVALEETKQQLQEVTYLAGNLTVALEETKQQLEKVTIAIAKSDAKINASNQAIAENADDNARTREVAYSVASAGLGVIGLMLAAYTIKHCCFPTKAAKDPNTLAQNLMAAAARDQLLAKPANSLLIQSTSALRDTLTERWEVRNALYTQVTRPFITVYIAAAPQEPENAATLRTTLRELKAIQETADDDMTPDSLTRMGTCLKTLRALNEPAKTDVTALTEAIVKESKAARESIERNKNGLPTIPPYIALLGFRNLNLGLAPTAQVYIDCVLNPGDIGNDDNPEALTKDQVTAMQTALAAGRDVQEAITTEIDSIKTAARRLFDAETTRMGWLTQQTRDSLPQIGVFTKAVADMWEIVPESFRAALQARQDLRGALVDTLNKNVDYVKGARDDVRENIHTLQAFKALGLPVEPTADQTLADLHNDNLLPSEPITDENLDTLGEADYRDLATAIAAADGVAAAIHTEIASIKAAAIEAFDSQTALNRRLPNTLKATHPIGELIGQFERAAITEDPGTQTIENLQRAMAARTALRREIIAYVNASRQAIAQTLADTAEDRTKLDDLRQIAQRFAGDEGQAAASGGNDLPEGPSAVVTVPLRTPTQESLRLLTSVNLPAADATEATLDDVTAEQFTALAAAIQASATFADTIAEETRTIKEGLLAKLNEERQRIATLHPSLRERLATELGTFETESAKITDQVDTYTLANFTTVFAAIGTVNTAAAAAAARESAATKIQRATRRVLESRLTGMESGLATPLNVSSPNPLSSQTLERGPHLDDVRINIPPAGATEQNSEDRQDRDIEEGRGGGGDN